MSAPKPTPDAGLSAALPRDLAEVLDQAAHLAATGRLGAAQRKLEGALRRHEGAPLLHALLARVLEANRHTARALHHLRRAAALAPADPAPLLNLIRLHGEAGQLDRARDLARTATSQFPANAIFLFQLSVAEMRADDTAASKANLEAATGRITDVDVAEESTQLAKWTTLTQAGTAMLAQANQANSLVLKLIGQ